MACAITGAFLRMKAGDLSELRGQVLAVTVADFGLRLQAVKLRVENSALEFAEPIIARNDVMLIPDSPRNAPAIVNRATRLGQRGVVGGNNATFARCQILARLKRE